MDSVTDFFDALSDERTWLRVLWVIFGAILVYVSLTVDTNRFAGI